MDILYAKLSLNTGDTAAALADRAFYVIYMLTQPTVTLQSLG